MTTFDTFSAPHAPVFSTARLSRFVARILNARAERALRTETYEALSFLSDSQLEDIGLTRGDLLAMR